MPSISPLLAVFFTFILIVLAGRAAARLALARGGTLPAVERNREIGHAAMGFGMAVLLAPGLPRPPLPVSVCFFAALATLAAADWAQRLWARRRGHAVASCGAAEGGRLLDPHHAVVALAMVVMLLRPGASGAGGGGVAGAAMPGMAGMAMGGAPSAAVLLLLGYVWVAALVLGYGMTRVLAVSQPESDGATALLSSPATVYACELAMTVLTGLMLLD